jgi:hypothetical protein
MNRRMFIYTAAASGVALSAPQRLLADEKKNFDSGKSFRAAKIKTVPPICHRRN